VPVPDARTDAVPGALRAQSPLSIDGGVPPRAAPSAPPELVADRRSV